MESNYDHSVVVYVAPFFEHLDNKSSPGIFIDDKVDSFYAHKLHKRVFKQWLFRVCASSLLRNVLFLEFLTP
jgi:hypothetical protein